MTENEVESRLPNRIHEVVKARIRGLIALYDESGNVKHDSTKGELREKYLIDFFRNLIPAKYAIEGGFICDLMGNNTYQLDFIIADTSEIPVIALGSDIAYVPVEAALATVEIKSTLRTKDREQIENQSRSILELKIVNFPEHGLDYGTDSKHVIPLFIFAYSTEVAEKTLDKWFEEIPNLLGICVINRFCKLSRSHIEGDNILREIVTYHGDDEFSETLSFISGIFDALSKVSSLRKKFTPILRAYIEAVAV